MVSTRDLSGPQKSGLEIKPETEQILVVGRGSVSLLEDLEITGEFVAGANQFTSIGSCFSADRCRREDVTTIVVKRLETVCEMEKTWSVRSVIFDEMKDNHGKMWVLTVLYQAEAFIERIREQINKKFHK